MRKGNTKKKIFEEAAILFSEKGYMATGMRELASRVGIEVSSLYSHIKSKEEILQKICMDNAGYFSEQMTIIKKQEGDSLDKIKSLIELHIQHSRDDVTAVTVFNDEWRNLKGKLLHDFVDKRKQYEQDFYEIILDGIDDGSIKSLNPKIILNSILSSMAWVYQKSKFNKQINKETVKNQMISYIISGIKAV